MGQALAAEKAAHEQFGRRGRVPRGAGEIYVMRNSASFGNGVRSRSWCLSRNSLLFSIKVGITAREWGRKESHTARKHRSTATLADSARGLAAPLPHRHRDSIAPAATVPDAPSARLRTLDFRACPRRGGLVSQYTQHDPKLIPSASS
jgi:hypothetical protein